MNTSIFLPPFDALDDAALLAHFRGARGVSCAPVADVDETRPEKIDAIVQGGFEFNGETHRLGDPIDWLHNPSADVEWHILLHKFYYAVGLGLAFERSGNAVYVQRWVELIDGWMRVTPPGFIAADVTGRRVQNWIYSLPLIVGPTTRESGASISPDFHRRLLNSLHEQVEFLCANLTDKRNHRTLELVAIFLAGVAFPEMKRSGHWRAFALEQFVANLASDLLPDGVHCELSTDYHHLVLKNALNFRRLAAANGVAVPASFDACLQRGLDFSLHVHKPDGSVPSLSDGDARGFLDLLREGAGLFGRADMLYVATQGREGTPPSERVAHFDSGGYHIVRSDWDNIDAQYLVFDCGPLGEGNHGHFDCLNFELAAHGRSLIVDPGRYTYSEAGAINWRVRFRGTAVHNTVCVDGCNQTRYEPKPTQPGTRHAAGTVRHKIGGPAPDAHLVEHHHSTAFDLLHGQARSHEYDAVHDRCIAFVDRRYWIVSDWLRAGSEHDYTLNFQLGEHAQGHADLDTDDTVHLSTPGLLLLQPARSGQWARLQPSWVSARYGDKQAAPALQTTARAHHVDFDTVLAPWLSGEPRLTVEDVAAVSLDNGASSNALRIAGDDFVDHWFHSRGPATQTWRCAGLEFSGRWAYWREDTEGSLQRVISHVDARVPRAAARAGFV